MEYLKMIARDVEFSTNLTQSYLAVEPEFTWIRVKIGWIIFEKNKIFVEGESLWRELVVK